MSDQSRMNQQIELRRRELELSNLLVFDGDDGDEMQRLLQNSCYLETPPRLAVYCEQGLGLPPIVLLNFVPCDYIAHPNDGMVEIVGLVGDTLHSVYLSKDHNHGQTGDIVSLVGAIQDGFPHHELEAFPEAVLNTERPPRAHLRD